MALFTLYITISGDSGKIWVQTVETPPRQSGLFDIHLSGLPGVLAPGAGQVHQQIARHPLLHDQVLGVIICRFHLH